jgi:release factor glutamine methyltransferase
MTIAGALAYATVQLTAAEIETPRYDAQLLLAWTLKVRREDLAREPERGLNEREQIIFDKAVSLRVLRRPLPYITGEAWFYGRAFKINRAVLIPRPETEMLAELALKACQHVQNPTMADIGTGSGCLAVTLACERLDARVWATDLSADALKEARKNVVRYGLEERVLLLHGDLLGPLPSSLRLDGIVSNPPYVTGAEIMDLQPEVRDYEPRLALSGLGDAAGVDGTALHRRILADAPPFLKPGGLVLLEVGQGQAERVAAIAQELGYRHIRIENDFSGIGRVVSACLSEYCS